MAESPRSESNYPASQVGSVSGRVPKIITSRFDIGTLIPTVTG